MTDTLILLVNLGTPDAPTIPAVKRYLNEFLSDRRVVETSPWLWQPILKGLILNTRPKQSAKAYQRVWTEQGSPLMVISQQQQVALQDRFVEKGIKVALAMRYGNPSIQQVLADYKTVKKIIVLPLYPQYSATTTASIFDKVSQVLSTWRYIPSLCFIQEYATHPLYIKALVQQIAHYWETHAQPEKLLFSFHGIPKQYIDAGDPYVQQVQATVEQLIQQLDFPKQDMALTFQSRMGRLEWIKPYTDVTLTQWAKQGIKKIQVCCPGFSADCLETLDEIALENRALFLAQGGESYAYIPALNSQTAHIDLMADLITKYL